MDSRVISSCTKLGELMRRLNGRLVTVESCTGGGVAWHITSVPGSSDWFDRAIVTYSNEAKMDMVAVPAATLDTHGAVSVQTAEAMAAGGLRFPGVTHALSVTGVAGPGGGSADKPVGMVCFSWACRDGEEVQIMASESCQFDGDRESVRRASIQQALDRMIELAEAYLV